MFQHLLLLLEENVLKMLLLLLGEGQHAFLDGVWVLEGVGIGLHWR